MDLLTKINTNSLETGAFDLMLIATADDRYKNIDFTAFRIPGVDTRNVISQAGDFLYRA